MSAVIERGQFVGPFVIEEKIAEGGMGAVYRARNRVTDDARALKVVRPELASNDEFVRRFVRELKIASEVRHRNLVVCYEPGVDGELLYLPMELLTGQTLHAHMREKKVLSPEEVAAILGPVCDALQAVHERHILHRDLKPLNIFLAEVDGAVLPKVLDFGTARSVTDDEHTRTGLVIGSPHYMAPEQAEGRRDLDVRIDQYSVGVIAYQALTGRRPYEADDTGHVLAKVLRGDSFPDLTELRPTIPSGLADTVRRAMAHNREDRFVSVAALGRSLVAAAGQQYEATIVLDPPAPADASGGPETPAEREAEAASEDPFVAPPPERKPRTRGPLVWVAVSSVVAVVAIGVWAIWPDGDAFEVAPVASSSADGVADTSEAPPSESTDTPRAEGQEPPPSETESDPSQLADGAGATPPAEPEESRRRAVRPSMSSRARATRPAAPANTDSAESEEPVEPGFLVPEIDP